MTVDPERLRAWLDGWVAGHHDSSYAVTPETVTLTGTPLDSAVATTETVECVVPFPPMAVSEELAYGGLIEHAIAERRVGVLLVRRGGYAVGVFDGRRLVASKVGSRYVQGRTAAGGWSQQRFARRRQNQARKLYDEAAEVTERVLLPYRDRLDAMVLGGDKQGAETVLAADRLSDLRALVVPRRLTEVPDPKEAVLRKTPRLFRSVQIRLYNESE